MPTKRLPLSREMLRALRLVEWGLDPRATRFRIRDKTLTALHRRRLLDTNNHLTKTGREVVEQS